jgi:stage II sporulation protein M
MDTNEENIHQRGLFASLGRHLAEAKAPIAAVVLVFALGVAMSGRMPTQAEELVAPLVELARRLQGMGPLALILAIFFRNAVVVGLTMLSGVLLGVVPLAAALANGMLAGYIIGLSPQNFWMVLPHGIFELPAAFIGWGLGVWCGMWAFHPPRWQTLRSRLGRSIRLYFILLLPLLAVAAVIEGGMVFLLR